MEEAKVKISSCVAKGAKPSSMCVSVLYEKSIKLIYHRYAVIKMTAKMAVRYTCKNNVLLDS